MILTEPFERPAAQQAQLMGAVLDTVAVPHPVQGLEEAQLAALAERIAAQVLPLLEEDSFLETESEHSETPSPYRSPDPRSPVRRFRQMANEPVMETE